MANIDFLQQNVNQIRKSIRDIDDSYNNEWDILAELCQNAVDAIRKAKIEKGRIEIHINSQNKSISISDNGCGIDPQKMPILLAPFSTDKDEDEDSIGEKGVGLSFVIFQSNDFYIKSGNANGVSEGKIFDALIWKESNDLNNVQLHHNDLNEKFFGTFVELKKVKDLFLFQLSFNQLKFLLRTRTSLGNTIGIWNPDIDIEIIVKHTNQDGQLTQEKIPFRYFLPYEGLKKSAIIDMEEFLVYNSVDRTDQEKRKKLKDKLIYKKGFFDHKGRTIRYWSCFVPSRKTWSAISLFNKIATEEQFDNSDFLDNFGFVTFQPGIYSSVKGMPTGIAIEHPITGAQGAWPQLFILFEDRYIKFDIGRKALHGSQTRIFKQYSRLIFLEYQKLAKYISGEPSTFTTPEWDKNEIFAQIEKILPLGKSDIKLQKIPKGQEASVVGLFYECIGNGKIRDLLPLSSGYKRKYDLYAKWGNKQVVIEFKASLKDILDDFNDEKNYLMK